MADRLLLSFDAPLPSSTPRRDLEHDDRFDAETGSARRRVQVTGLRNPRLISSAHGAIKHLMLWYPGGTRRVTYEDLVRKLPGTARVTLVAHPDALAEAELIAAAAAGDIEIMTTPSYLNFSVWAEDACLVVEDDGAEEPLTYLVEPFSFSRYGDQVVVDLVAQASEAVASTQLPLSFQGGNVLVGDDVLVGRDYLDETITLGLEGQTPIVHFPTQGPPEEMERFGAELFARSLDPSRQFHFLASSPSARPADGPVRRGEEVWWNRVTGGWGRRQPIFHIDMFVSLAGRLAPGSPYRVLVGDPSAADEIMGWAAVPHELQSEFDEIAAQLDGLGFEVHRAPLPVIDAAYRFPVPQPVQLSDGTSLEIAGEIEWYHATSNNCLVQIVGDAREVWLPTYGQEAAPDLAPIDARHRELWEGLGFVVHQLSDFHHLARASGALHCIKKYLARGPATGS